MQVGIFNCLFIFVIAALNDYVIVASIIVIAIRNPINCAALINRIQNKSFCLHNIYVCTVYIYYVYINTHACMYIFKKNMLCLYFKYIYI